MEVYDNLGVEYLIKGSFPQHATRFSMPLREEEFSGFERRPSDTTNYVEQNQYHDLIAKSISLSVNIELCWEENNECGFGQQRIRYLRNNTLNIFPWVLVKLLGGLWKTVSESQSKQWQIWCEEEGINLRSLME
ncbi:hypothetical protein VNO78_16470 [Psophocarpus tetragonolobus]|uniref:Uncharacterized protein n=1 Tax=Psophocarpus tetragonolobus TaxID=3891 RepID=A0AAN9SID8_PSOTE